MLSTIVGLVALYLIIHLIKRGYRIFRLYSDTIPDDIIMDLMSEFVSDAKENDIQARRIQDDEGQDTVLCAREASRKSRSL